MPGDPFYSSKEWRDCRRAYIQSHPVCEVAGCEKPTKHVDHKTSRRKGGAPLNHANLKGMCHSHHSAKTARFDGAFGNKPSTKGVDADGWPLHPMPTTINLGR
jgi:5-methylcytosine-specific restriction endonuclease McrA